MSLILGLETTSQNCSVVLFDSEKILSSRKNEETFKHSQVLFPMIQDVLTVVGASVKDLDAIAISNGPGSFTGLRIGAAAALGMCHALEIPIIAINTLESLIWKAQQLCHEEKKLYCPMIDARRMEVYCMISNFNKEIILQQQAKIIDTDSFKEFAEEIICFGDGAGKCKEVLKYNHKIQFLDGVDTDATNLCELARKRFFDKDFDDILNFEINYLK